MSKLDIQFVRKQFPALTQDFIYMDNAGGSQVLGSVANTIAEYLTSHNVQLGADYSVSQKSTTLVAEAQEILRSYINANSTDEVIFGASSSLLFRILAMGIGETLKAGDEIVVSRADHEANIGPWVDLSSKGIVIKYLEFDKRGALTWENLEPLLNDRTRLVAWGHVSNLFGGINKVKEVAINLRERGILSAVDGVAFAPHHAINVKDLEVDFYCFSTYKVFGPHSAILYCRKSHAETLPRFNHYFIKESPYKFLPGNVNFELVVGYAFGLKDYFESLHAHHYGQTALAFHAKVSDCFELTSSFEEVLVRKLLTFLRNKREVKIIGTPAWGKSERVATISFYSNRQKSSEIVSQIDKSNIGIRFGDFYAMNIISDLGIKDKDGVVRVSLLHYNTVAEVEQLIELFDEILD